MYTTKIVNGYGNAAVFGEKAKTATAAPCFYAMNLFPWVQHNEPYFASSVELNEAREPQEVTKQVVGIHVLLTRSLFGEGIPRKLLQRVSLAKPTSAALRF
jgi:hypothetical protein